MALLSKNFDFVVSIFGYHTDPPRNMLFVPENPFKWDESFYISEDRINNNLYIPSLWDSTTANVERNFFQSGHGFDDNISLSKILKYGIDGKLKWLPEILHGTYYSRNIPYYLYSDSSIVRTLEEEYTSDGRSKINLLNMPKIGVPISINTLKLDSNLNIVLSKKLQKVGRFTGIAFNGVELDTTTGENLDQSLQEFIVYYNADYIMYDWKIPYPLGPGEVTFMLPKVPLKDFNVFFSRKDIFQTEKFLAGKYGSLVYGNALYGTGVENVGDYMINFDTGEVTVILDQAYVDLGHVTFAWDYPASIEFNKNFVVDYGLSISTPTADDLTSFIRGPQSSGLENQIVGIGEFPVIDYTTDRFLDTENFKLYLYDPTTQLFETDWTRVTDLETSGPLDKHYLLDSFSGTVSFGDGINGLIPATFKYFVFALKTSLRIEYEPASSTDYWTDRRMDIHPLHNNLNSGLQLKR